MSLSFFESGSEAVEPCLPQAPIGCEPPVKHLERLRPEGVEATLPIWPHRNKTRLAKDSQMAGDPGLVNPGLLDDVIDLLLARAQRLDDTAAGWIGQSLEGA